MLNQPVPDFELPSTGNKIFRLSEASGKNLVIYFYPKDNTPGCTTEGQQFRDAYTRISPSSTAISWVSRETASSRTRISR